MEFELFYSYLKEQIAGPTDKLLCKRRKTPQTALDMWKFSRSGRKDSSFLLEPLVQGKLVYLISGVSAVFTSQKDHDVHIPRIHCFSGMCTYLHVTYDRNFPRVSDPDAEPNSSEPTADYGGSCNAPSERKLTPMSHENEDTLPEGDLTPKSLENSYEQPGPQLTPKSPGEAGVAQDEDTLPELPRFSPVDMPSPIREDDSPFKTVRRTPHSGLGGTGVTEMPQSVRTNSLPGQSTTHSDHMASLFPVNDDYDDQPEIPGLLSTPGGISDPDTGTTGLGSMSARTR